MNNERDILEIKHLNYRQGGDRESQRLLSNFEIKDGAFRLSVVASVSRQMKISRMASGCGMKTSWRPATCPMLPSERHNITPT
jgi:hypothetical protein